jgi:hypothetical protein
MRPRVNKFGAKRSHCSAGHEHASKREASRCNDLRILERAGEITHLEQQPAFWFVINGEQVKHGNGRRVGYTADFSYFERDAFVVEDAKGAYRDDAWTLRKAIFKALFPSVELREV